MIRALLIALCFVLSIEIIAEASELKLSAHTGIWYMNWEQINQNEDVLGDKAVATDYDIENAIGVSAGIQARYKFINFQADYVKSEDASNSRKKLSTLAGVLRFSGLFDRVDLEISGLRTEFRGSIAAKYQSLTGTGDFKSDLRMVDLVVFPFKYVGFGYRQMDYEFPTDVYLLHKDHNTPLCIFPDGSGGCLSNGGLMDLRYKGYFGQLVFDNSRLLIGKDDYVGPLFSVRAGMGKIDASSDTADVVDAAIGSTYNNGKSVLGNGSAQFIEGELGLMMKRKINEHMKMIVSGGYRYSYMDVTIDQTADYSLVSEFTTIFHGPFLQLNVEF